MGGGIQAVEMVQRTCGLPQQVTYKKLFARAVGCEKNEPKAYARYAEEAAKFLEPPAEIPSAELAILLIPRGIRHPISNTTANSTKRDADLLKIRGPHKQLNQSKNC